MTSSPRGTGPTPQRWVKARRSDSASTCVEIMIDADAYHIRDSKDAGHGPVLTLSTPDWHRLCDILLAAPSPFREQPVQAGGLRVGLHADGRLTIQRLGSGSEDEPTLEFTPLEVECFLDGIRGGEFAAQAPLLHPTGTTA